MAALEARARSSAWHGALSLSFAARAGKTALVQRRHVGPFCVQQPFYPGDGVCHVYLLHPPGGLAAGDELVLDTEIGSNAAALLTTPAATKFYRSDGAASVQRQTLRVAAGGSLEWLPLESILFGGSRAAIDTRIALDAGARFIGWEQTSLGRPLSGDRYATGSLEQRTRIDVAGVPRLIERLRWQTGDRLLEADWGLAGFTVCGTLYACPADERVLADVRERLGIATPSFDAPRPAVAPPSMRCGATLLDDLLVVRALGRDPEQLRELFESLWRSLRPAVLGREPSAPRIWRT